MTTVRPLSRLLAVLSLSATSALAQHPAAAPIPIGAVLSLTGPLAVVGLPERDGMRLALKQINAAGGIAGRPLELILEDDGSSPDAALSKVNALVHGRKVPVVLGATGLASTVAMGAVTSAQKVLQIAFSGMGPAVERDRSCVFHLTPAQELNARSLLEYATRQLKARRLALLHDSGFGQSVANSLRQLSSEYGVELAVTEKFDIGSTDITTQAVKVREANPGAVLVVTSNATAFRQIRQVKLTAPVIATHVSAPYDIVRAMGEGSEGVVFADFLVAEEPLPRQQAFVNAFVPEYRRLPKNFDAAGYDSLMLVAAALKKAGAQATGEQLCAAARGPFQGQMAAYDFSAPDMGGLTPGSFVYSTWVKERFVRVPLKGTK
jgi:branched-chain amino acid transport system substrate-binding protein